MGNYHAPCGAGEKLEITSNAYLLQTIVEQRVAVAAFFCCSTIEQVSETRNKNTYVVFKYKVHVGGISIIREVHVYFKTFF